MRNWRDDFLWEDPQLLVLEKWFNSLSDDDLMEGCNLSEEELQWGENTKACYNAVLDELERGPEDPNSIPLDDLVSNAETILGIWTQEREENRHRHH